MGRVGDRKGGKGKGRDKQEDDDDHYIPCSDWLVALAVKVPRCLAQLIHQVSTKRERLTPRHVPLALERSRLEHFHHASHSTRCRQMFQSHSLQQWERLLRGQAATRSPLYP